MLNALLAGLAIGSLYGATALIFNVTFSTSKILSLTTGHLVMLGGVFGAFFLGVLRWPWPLALLAVLVIGALVGYLTDLIAIRRVIDSSDSHLSLLSTLALATIIQQAVGLWWGTESRPFPRFLSSEFNGLLDEKFWLPIGLVIVLGVALTFFYRQTMSGKLFLAMSQDAFAARARGIATDRIRAVSFALAGAMGGAIGFAAGQLTFAFYALGNIMVLYGFIALAVGGIGSNLGSVLAGWIIGVIAAVAMYYVGGEYEKTIAVCILTAVLLIRPQGMFGAKNSRPV